NLSHHLHFLVPPVQQAGFYSHKTAVGAVRTYVLPLKDYQIQVSQQERVREAFAWELAGSMFIPYLIILPFAIFALAAI
ncbi:two-component sensor histidine kinase, partial [Acinetobacter baumannii]